MSKNIGRLLFWFKDGEEGLYEYTVRFRALAMLLNRLINENYFGKKIIFLNLNFYTQASYNQNDKLELNYTHSYGGHVQHDSTFLRDLFDKKSIVEQKRQLWDLAFEVMLRVAADTKNLDLKTSSETANKKGLEQGLNEDFILLQDFNHIGENLLKAELWAEFEEDKVSARFKIFKNNELIFNKVIESTRPDVEFFYEMYKKIIFDSKGQIVIKGHYDVEYLPLVIKIDEII